LRQSKQKRLTVSSSIRTTLRRIAFEALYGPFAWAYDWVSGTFFLGQWRVWQHAAMWHLQGKRILELGIGTGNLQADLVRAGFEVYGIDFSPQMMRQASRKARKLGIGRFRVCRARAQALPFPDGSFDTIVSTFPSDYIGDPATLREIERVLRPGGRLVVVPGGWLTPTGARGRFLEGVARVVYEEDSKSSPPRNPLESYPREAAWIRTLAARMRAVGFETGAYVASNSKGATIVIVADLKSEPGD
jgi:SAM-dependent methyltransferase